VQITIMHRSFRNRAPIEGANDRGTRIRLSNGVATKGMGMTELQERIVREREEIAARVASFRATQEKFQREREEFVSHTWQNIRKGDPIPNWS
jgi:hypothetical protein